MNAPWIPADLPAPAAAEPLRSPVDLRADDPDAGALRWTSGIVATAALFLLLTNSGAVRGWASDLEPAPHMEPVMTAADGWHGFASGVGLDAPVETMRGWWRHAQSARFAEAEGQR